MIQAQLQRARFVAATNDPPVQPTASTLGTKGNAILSPRTPTGLLTTGFAFFVKAILLTTVTVWKRDPVSGFWAKLLVATPPDLAPFKWVSVCEINASELYFQTDASDDDGFSAGVFYEEFGNSQV